MNDIVLSARGLGKRYLIGHKTVDRLQTFRERIMAGAGELVRNMRRTARGQQLVQGEVEEFWALRDVDFDIRRGDTVGIIGRNGAGKSTLLKILSRITEPTTGRVDIRGRVASLLEVGTGFHPELTGRENIFLNGTILGMSRAEIRRKLDQIIDFAEVEKFLDTPVKRYSSGMYVRLAFSVAAHLEPEVLIVDEVLAVGDAEFQRKCLGKMGEVAGEGRTVLFVSHNMGAVARLCRRAIFLQGGSVVRSGPTEQVIAATTASWGTDSANHAAIDLAVGPLSQLAINISGGTSAAGLLTGGEANIAVRISSREPIPNAACEIMLFGADDQPLFHTKTRPIWDIPVSIDHRGTEVLLRLPELPLVPGRYTVGLAISIPNVQYLFKDERFCVMTVDGVGWGPDDVAEMSRARPVWPRHEWQVSRHEAAVCA